MGKRPQLLLAFGLGLGLMIGLLAVTASSEARSAETTLAGDPVIDEP